MKLEPQWAKKSFLQGIGSLYGKSSGNIIKLYQKQKP